MTGPDRDDLQPARPWEELVAASRKRGSALRRRRRALTATPLLGLVAATALVITSRPDARAPSHLDITDRPSSTESAESFPAPSTLETPQPAPRAPERGATSEGAAERGKVVRPHVGTRPREIEVRPTPAVPRAKPAQGPRIVFSSMRDGSDSEIYVMNADGTGQRALTSNGVNENGPQPSPDGKWIAFGSYDDMRGGLFVMRSDGTDRRRLTHRVCRTDGVWVCTVSAPAWSPDGRWIAFTYGDVYAECEVYDDCAAIWVVRADGSGLRRITSGWSPAWSPDGRRLAFVDFRPGTNAATCDTWYAETCDGNLYTVAVDGSDRTDLGIAGADPAWSPIAPLLAFAAQAEGDYRVMLLDLRTDDVETVTQSLGPNDAARTPEFSRDGRYLLFDSFRADQQPCSPCTGEPERYNWDIYVYDLLRRGERQLTDAPRRDLAPSWLYG